MRTKKTIEYNLKRSVESEDVIAFRVLFETVEEVRLFMKSMDLLKAGIEKMLLRGEAIMYSRNMIFHSEDHVDFLSHTHDLR